jgi:hypothetical protein
LIQRSFNFLALQDIWWLLESLVFAQLEGIAEGQSQIHLFVDCFRTIRGLCRGNKCKSILLSFVLALPEGIDWGNVKSRGDNMTAAPSVLLLPEASQRAGA